MLDHSKGEGQFFMFYGSTTHRFLVCPLATHVQSVPVDFCEQKFFFPVLDKKRKTITKTHQCATCNEWKLFQGLDIPIEVSVNFSLGFFFLHFQGLKSFPILENLPLRLAGGVPPPEFSSSP